MGKLVLCLLCRAAMRKFILVSAVTIALALAGCAGSTESTDSGSAKTYNVPVEAAHAVTGSARTISISVTQDGEELGSGTYNTAGKSADDFVTLFNVKASAGPLKIQAFEGNNPLNFKSIDPAKCTDPNFQIHIVDGAVHVWSNCD